MPEISPEQFDVLITGVLMLLAFWLGAKRMYWSGS